MSVFPPETTRRPLDGFSWNLIFEIFRKSVEKIKVAFNFDKYNGYFTWRLFTIIKISLWILLIMRNVSNTNCRQNQNSRFMLGNFFRKLCCLWDNVEKYGEIENPQMAIWRLVACRISRATRVQTHVYAPPPHTHTHREILAAFLRQQWFCERASMLHYNTLPLLLLFSFTRCKEKPITHDYKRDLTKSQTWLLFRFCDVSFAITVAALFWIYSLFWAKFRKGLKMCQCVIYPKKVCSD